tara:strand:+ start:1809 stop:3152 length:1344 start_codon:yes stop_codon:yes gene_type:complete
MDEKTTLLCSPSQANTAKLCRRLWGFRYLDKVRSAPTPGQAKGTALHGIGENWLRSGEVPPDTDIGQRFLTGIHHLPEPSPDILVEYGFLFEDGDVHWRGFVDCVDPTGDMIVVIDHKSTKNFYWAKKPEDLKTDTQGIVYAKAMMDKFKVDVVEARWVYYLMDGQPQSRKVSVILKKEHVEKEYKGLKILGEELLETKKTTTTGLDIPVQYPNPGCQAFGGCDFGEICAAKKEGKDMSDLLSRLMKMKDNGIDQGVQALHAAVNPPTTVIETKPEPVAETKPEPVQAVLSEAVETSPEPSKRKGRPKGSKNRKKVVEQDDAEKIIAQSQDTTLETGVEGMAFEKEGQQGKHPFTLYIDCIPDSGATSVNELLEKAAEQASLENDVAHYRLIPYGAGAGALCTKFKELCWGEDYIKGNWFMSSNNQLHTDAMPALEELAKSIVRGTR